MRNGYLTSGEVAKLLHVSPKTVCRWAVEGRIPFMMTLGGHRRFPLDVVQKMTKVYSPIDEIIGEVAPC